jgi:methylase of polypeptide subunit release factors
MIHKLFQVARHGELHSPHTAPKLPDARILDLGCGTGIWAIDMCDKYQKSEVSRNSMRLLLRELTIIVRIGYWSRTQLYAAFMVGSTIQPLEHVRN